jgi:hypothetical protein
MFRIPLAAVLATTALAAGTVALTLSADSATAGPSYTSTRYVAHDIEGNFAMADLADPQNGQPGIGDEMAFTQRLTRGGHTVGRVSNVAVGVDAQRNLFHSTGTLQLRHGRVEFAGLVSQTPHFVLAVIGGTGTYTGARGTVVFDNDNGRQLLTLRLRH